MNPSVSTQTRIVVRDNVSYPAVTMCFKNWENQGYDKAILQVGLNRDDYPTNQMAWWSFWAELRQIKTLDAIWWVGCM